MPSGGFVYMDPAALADDVRAGLVALTRQQWRAARSWAKEHETDGAVVVVGDVLPLTFARWACAPLRYAFVGCAKSEHYVRDASCAGFDCREKFDQARLRFPERGLEALSAGIFRGVYLPWEVALIGARACVLAAPRDDLTAETLRGQVPRVWRGKVLALGNPMMDFCDAGSREAREEADRRLTVAVEAAPGLSNHKRADVSKSHKQCATRCVVLLPGTRWPEARANMVLLLKAAAEAQARCSPHGAPNVALLAPLPPVFDCAKAIEVAECAGWKLLERTSTSTSAENIVLRRGGWRLLLGGDITFAASLRRAERGLCMAGTATEQFVGLGKVAHTLECGAGPQFTPAFAEAQVRLLGGESVRLAPDPAAAGADLAAALAASRTETEARAKMAAANGRARMGAPGGATRIAEALKRELALCASVPSKVDESPV